MDYFFFFSIFLYTKCLETGIVVKSYRKNTHRSYIVVTNLPKPLKSIYFASQF